LVEGMSEGLLTAILAVQAEVGPIAPDAVNPHFNSKFTSLAKVVETVGPILNRHGLTWRTFPTTNEHGQPALRYRLQHTESGEMDEDVMPLLLGKVDSQGLGSALTYSRRYALCAVLNLVADDDDDGHGASAPAGRTSQSDSPSEKQLDYLKSLVTREKPSEGVLRALLTRVGADGVDPTAAGWSKALNKAQVSQLIETFKNGVLPTGESDIPSDAPEFSRDPEIPEDDPSIPFDAVGAEHER
jgi:hypothetical protein